MGSYGRAMHAQRSDPWLSPCDPPADLWDTAPRGKRLASGHNSEYAPSGRGKGWEEPGEKQHGNRKKKWKRIAVGKKIKRRKEKYSLSPGGMRMLNTEIHSGLLCFLNLFHLKCNKL